MEYTEAIRRLSEALNMTESETVDVIHAVVWKMPTTMVSGHVSDPVEAPDTVRSMIDAGIETARRRRVQEAAEKGAGPGFSVIQAREEQRTDEDEVG